MLKPFIELMKQQPDQKTEHQDGRGFNNHRQQHELDPRNTVAPNDNDDKMLVNRYSGITLQAESPSGIEEDVSNDMDCSCDGQ